MKSIEMNLLVIAHQAATNADNAIKNTGVVFHYHYDMPMFTAYLPGGNYKDVITFITDGKTFTPHKKEDRNHHQLQEIREYIENRFFLEYKPLQE